MTASPRRPITPQDVSPDAAAPVDVLSRELRRLTVIARLEASRRRTPPPPSRYLRSSVRPHRDVA